MLAHFFLKSLTQQQFIGRFSQYTDSSYILPEARPGHFNTIMPWTQYARMKKADLASIYSYLRHLQPVRNTVEKFSLPDKK